VSVYVDEPIWPYGRMMMCHMVADSRAELDEMADTVGVPRRWIQKPGTDREHYDICKSKRKEAVRAGAIEMTCADLVRLVRADGRPVR
jgi:hypothetical protein